MLAGGVDVVVVPVAVDMPGVHTSEYALESIDNIYMEVDESPDKVVVATTVDDILVAHKTGKIALLLGMEGGMPLGGEIGLLRIFYRLGVRLIGLTWYHRNLISDGVGERTNCGLSEFGVELVKEMNRLGIIIDVAHLSKAGFYDVLELTKRPIVASHANAKSVYDNFRNLDDEQIKALSENGGVIGVMVADGRRIGARAADRNLQGLMGHISHISHLVGVDHVGLGLDFLDFLERDYFRELIGSHPDLPFPKDIENITKVHNITRELVNRGYSDSEIKRVLGGNFLRVLKEVIG
jgi:membrane dipeptidase